MEPCGSVTKSVRSMASNARGSGVVVQLGHAPKRIDILTAIDGVSFEVCWPARIEIEIGGVSVPFIDADHLVVNKRASGRLQGLADVEILTGGGREPT